MKKGKYKISTFINCCIDSYYIGDYDYERYGLSMTIYNKR